ncbi:MAG: TonB-dependent receptor, partial [Oceanicaulis sp.]|nr:TonB-dependent receptor [Oceanicaulis sp.]
MKTRHNRLAGVSSAVLALSLSVIGSAYAQHPLSGRVVDERGNPLPGARVSVSESGATATTNRQGEFSFSSLPEGEVTLTASYLGLPTGTRGVSVSATEANVITFTLTDTAPGVDRIVITGQILDGAARALNQQRTNSATTNIVSADSIGRFPDANIAEALQRVPGFGIQRDQGEGRFVNLRGAPAEFTGVSVDGVSIASPDDGTRAIDLDTIPSDVVNAIEVSKTLLPFQDADSIAGRVNLVTRSPFDRSGLRINTQGGVSYNEFGGNNDVRASGVVSNTFGPDQRFGALFSASYSRTDRQVDNIEADWVIETDPVSGNDVFVVDEWSFKDYDTRRTRTAFTGGLEFRPDDVTLYYLRGTYSRFRDDEFRNSLDVDLGAGNLLAATNNTTATWDRARFQKEVRHRIVQNVIWTMSAGGEHDFSGFELDYSLSFNRSEQTYPTRYQLRYRSSLRPEVSYDYTNFDEPAISLFQTNEHLDLGAYAFRQFDEREQDTIKDEWAARANVTFQGGLFGQAAEHRFGASARLTDATTDENRWRSRDNSFAPPLGLAGMLGDQPSQNFGYFLGNKFDQGRQGEWHGSFRSAVRQPGNVRASQSITGDYSVDENIYAAYGMTEFDFGNTSVITGLRVEHTDFSSTAFRFNEDTDEAVANSNSRQYTNWFPNLTVRHEFSENLVGRFALTRAISRPNYPDVVARISAGDTAPLTVRRGNPDLNPTLANNVDAGLEYYLETLGLLAVNVFYKDLEDYEFTLRTPGEFEGLPATFVQAENAPDGYIRGVELT